MTFTRDICYELIMYILQFHGFSYLCEDKLRIKQHCLFATLKSYELVKTIFYRDEKFDEKSNFKLLIATIKFIKSTQ